MGKSLFQLITAAIVASLLTAGTAHARFLQTDPIGYEGGNNLYAYVENDPINQLDPDGKKPESVMDRLYVYPRLTPEQQRLAEEQHYRIGEQAFNGMLTGASLAPIGGIALRGGSLLIRGGLRIAANSRFARTTTRVAEVAAQRGLGTARAARKGQGVRFTGKKGEEIRVMRGDRNAQNASQRSDYVQVRSGGKVRNAQGEEIKPTEEFPRPSQNPEAHIPVREFLENIR